MTSDVAAHIDRLKRLAGVTSDQQLADRIGIAKQTISAWRVRGAIPLAMDARLADTFGPDAAFSERYRHAADTREDYVLYALFLLVGARMGAAHASAGEAPIRIAVALAEMEPTLRRLVREIGFDSLTPAEVYTVLRGRIEADAIPELRGLAPIAAEVSR